MAQFIVSYDLKTTSPDPHYQFLREAYNTGWSQWIPIGVSRYHKLPNTTLVGNYDDIGAAEVAFSAAIAATSRAIGRPVIAEKWIITLAPSTRSTSDETK